MSMLDELVDDNSFELVVLVELVKVDVVFFVEVMVEIVFLLLSLVLFS